MKQFAERLKTDKDFAAEFKEYMSGNNAKIKEGTRSIAKQLNELAMGSIKEFAASKGIELGDDEQIDKSLAELNKQICLQMDEMIVKSFTPVMVALEGSMKLPFDQPPEMIKAIRENKELHAECMHKADAAVEAAIKKCGEEMNAAVEAAFKEFADKVGYVSPDGSLGEMNRFIAKKLNEVVGTQFKALQQTTRLADEIRD